MLRRFAPLFAAALLMALDAHAAEPAGATSSVKSMFVKPVVLRGTLGNAPIQATIRTKDDFEDGIEGEYFLFGHSQRILLAGEIEGDELLLEESENGTDVSGQWNGVYADGLVTGEWQSADGTVAKPFTLRLPESAVKEKPGVSSAAGGAPRQ